MPLEMTVAIDALNSKLRRAIEDVMKLGLLVLNRSEDVWKMAPRNGSWQMASAVINAGAREVNV